MDHSMFGGYIGPSPLLEIPTCSRWLLLFFVLQSRRLGKMWPYCVLQSFVQRQPLVTTARPLVQQRCATFKNSCDISGMLLHVPYGIS